MREPGILWFVRMPRLVKMLFCISIGGAPLAYVGEKYRSTGCLTTVLLTK